MSAESAVYAALSGAAAVTALVSTRIYPDTREQETDLPAVIFVRTGTAFEVDIHGAVDLTRTTVAVISFALTRAGAEALADACQAALLAARMTPSERLSDFDPEAEIYSSTLVIEHLQ